MSQTWYSLVTVSTPPLSFRISSLGLKTGVSRRSLTFAPTTLGRVFITTTQFLSVCQNTVKCQVDRIALWDSVFHTVHSGCTFWQMLHHSDTHAYRKLAQYALYTHCMLFSFRNSQYSILNIPKDKPTSPHLPRTRTYFQTKNAHTHSKICIIKHAFILSNT